MTANGLVQIGLFFLLLLASVKPVGWYLARVYEGRPLGVEKLLGPVERLLYRSAGIRPEAEMDWKTYSLALLGFNAAGFFLLYALQRFQGALPLNPQGVGAVPPELAFNTAVSFVSNTDWQAYAGETTMSHLTQMLGLTVQNFVSAATGLAILAALIRGLARRSAETIGNCWVDLTRGTLYLLLPASCLLALLLVSQGVVQTFDASRTVRLLQPRPATDAGPPLTQQIIAVGPVASQVAIKQLGTNGGGFFNANAAHPLENPTPLSNLLELLAILLIPASQCYTFGAMVGDTRQGWALLAVMMVILLPLLLLGLWAEQAGTPTFAALGLDQVPSDRQPGGNMEGKEARFGIVNSVLWAAVTTAASNGSVNAMHDSYTPLGGLVPLLLILLGEVVFGGVGSGLYGLLVFAIVAVFLAGLMIGRTPEYLGKKIEPFEMKMASLVVLLMPIVVLANTAVAVAIPAGHAATLNPGPHGFTEIFYAFSSQGNNNGSAFAGLNANTPFYNLTGGLAMLVARFWLAIPVLALAGSFARKTPTPAGPGTLPTHTPLFVLLLVGLVLIVGALTFAPALALGPVVEHLLMAGAR
ncbi:potassium-transporting ATPase subunit KdpA [Nitrospira sp. Kam-Ns4a]